MQKALIADIRTMQRRRKNPRNLCADLLKIRWKDASGVVYREYATLEDISETGLCLRMDQPIDPQIEVTILYPRGKFVGRIKYSRFENDGYLLGIEFLDGYHWSRRQYEPPHLVQFRLKPTGSLR